MFQHILVAIDGSKISDNALKTAIEEARVWKAQIHVVYVVETGLFSSLPMDNTWEIMYSMLEKEGKNALEAAKEMADQTGVKMETSMRQGHAGNEILKAIAELPIDLVVMGSHGKSEVDRILLGSVSLIHRIELSKNRHGGATIESMKVADFMTTEVVSVEIPGNRDDVLKILKRTGISGVPVLKEGKLVGIITRKDLLRKADETQLGLLMTRNPATVTPDTPAEEAARILIEKNVRRLPVIEDEKLVGLLSVADLVHAIAQMRIKDEIKPYYVSQTFALWEETPLPLVGRIMEISGFEAIPILDAESKLQGIISERDLIRHSSIEDTVEVSDFSNGTDDDEWTWESIRDMHTISYGISKIQLPDKAVKTAMVSNVISVPLNAEVSECALKMKRGRVDQLPVVNGDKKLVAMLFDRDLIRAMCRSPEQ